MFRTETGNEDVSVSDESIVKNLEVWDEYERLYYPGRARTYSRVLDLIGSTGSQRLLDVGSALGWFMEMAAERGFETWGIEPSSEVTSLGKQRTGRPVQMAVVEHTPYPARSFHVVTMFDVLEHTDDPVVALREVSRMLKDDGVLVVRVPDLDGLLPRISHFVHRVTRGRYAQPVHLLWRFHRWGFNQRSLETLFEKTGFRVLVQYGEDAQDLVAMKQKHWARNPIVRTGVKAIIHFSHIFGLWDERVMIVRKVSTIA